jgi:CheY-like chemotaxis protein
MLKPSKRPAEILSIEDNPADVAMLKTLFSSVQASLNISFAEDGVEALDYLLGQGKYSHQPTRPDLILLDLNLPRKDGREVLKEIKQNKELKNIPVLVLSTSNNPRDISEAYSLGASAFVSKPMDLEWFQSVINAIEMFWLRVADLPNRRPETIITPPTKNF